MELWECFLGPRAVRDLEDPSQGPAVKFLCSRIWRSPDAPDPFLQGPLWCFHAWERRQWPWFLLTSGDTLYLLDRTEGQISWETRVRQVKRCAYTSRRTALEVLEEWTGGRRENGISFLRSAPSAGFLLAFETVPKRQLAIPRPRWLSLPRLGWIRDPREIERCLDGWMPRKYGNGARASA
jgi:hypothetical protein